MKTWIFQGNPEVFDIDSYLAATAGLITWRVARYAEQIEPGDTVYIWRSQGDQPQMAGIVAGPDTLENTVAVCATHHRFLHHGQERKDLAARLTALRHSDSSKGQM